MEILITYGSLVGLLLSMVIGWFLTLVGLPGNWLIVCMAALFAWASPETGSIHLSWLSVGALAVLAGVGEAAEFTASMWGTKRAGGSRRAAWMSLVGSLGGAIFGGIVGLPLPLIGSALGAVLGGALGALTGAALGEYTRGENHDKSISVGFAAFWGRLLGTCAKTLVATMLVVFVIVALFV